MCRFTAFTALKSCIGHAVAMRSWKCCTRGSRAAEQQGRLITAIESNVASQFKPFGSANSGSQSNYSKAWCVIAAPKFTTADLLDQAKEAIGLTQGWLGCGAYIQGTAGSCVVCAFLAV
jgi:hypothetical protein